MRFIIGFLSGVLGLLAGWFALAALVVAVSGPDRDGGIAMGAVFTIGPIGGLIGFVAGVLLFIKIGQVSVGQVSIDQVSVDKVSVDQVATDPVFIDQVSQGPLSPGAEQSGAAPARKRVSPAFAAVVLVLTAGLSWWGWYELIRSPYLTHGFMTLELQFRLPPGMALPPDEKDVHIDVEEGRQHATALLHARWRGTDGDKKGILASASLSMKTSRRVVHLELPGFPEQIWQIDLPSDPDPTPDYSPWRGSSGTAAPKIEMSFRLNADR